jgi:hypothetical protein
VPSVKELVSMQYSGGSALITAGDFRAQHQQHGERYRWFKAIPVANWREVEGAGRDGNLYIEQTLPEDARAFMHQTEVDFEDGELGLIPKGTSAISVMPDEAFLKRGDRISLPERRLPMIQLVTRGTGDADALLWTPVKSIIEVTLNGVAFTLGTDYQLLGNSIQWLQSKPDNGTQYTVEYFYEPMYFYIGSDRTPRPDSGGVLMPQRGAVRMWHPTERE